jgi:succinate-acetate transporter protein
LGAGVTGIAAGTLLLNLGKTTYSELEVVWIVGGGAGLFVGGIIALVLSFVGQPKSDDEIKV